MVTGGHPLSASSASPRGLDHRFTGPDGSRYATAEGMTNSHLVLALALCGMLVSQPLLSGTAFAQAPSASADAQALKQFEAAIAAYMAVRNKLHSEVHGPVKDSTASQVTNASDALAAAIQRARRDARQGAIFAAPAAAVIKRRIADAVRTNNLASVLADIDDEGKTGPTPTVHLRLPVSAQMATMPPSLLKVLPTLPKALEYRILGTYLVIRDVDASLILDFIPGAVPR